MVVIFSLYCIYVYSFHSLSLDRQTIELLHPFPFAFNNSRCLTLFVEYCHPNTHIVKDKTTLSIVEEFHVQFKDIYFIIDINLYVGFSIF